MNFETRKKKLMDIRRCALDMQNGTLPPSMMASLLASISTAIIVGVIMKQDPLLVVGTSLVVALLVYFRAPFSKSWAEALDNRLTDYEPIDHEAYATFHHATRERGGLDLPAVFSWIEQEMTALSAITPKVPDCAAHKFISKPVKPVANDRSQE
ncbi:MULTISPECIES: hypothetical protein [Pseudomonas]|uniref:Uncharacterized protein n=3 Tax=Pseudomonas TaxID=286 RepID=A0A2A3M1K3_PSEDL|nr:MULTISPECIES: hypothetical protein [Pseudomonas]TXG99567.1 MAG: hypothetical protein E6R08_01875 [Nevskiaceae bacterium]AGZ38233.1 KorG protein [Pseudomonas sp. VLB120]EKT4481316.1 hypothetical protein [Pseudomonas putida]MBA6061029.1 hypothetical protein [Pseudomonas juntendi]MCE0945650.1 hypothetical protein [Pseudomonas asiatica]